MSTKKKLLEAAAGAAGGEALYVEDVFSTYLYEGTGSTQTIQNGVKLGNNFAGPSARFNNTSDYLNGTLSGGSDTKTITFSGWFYKLTNETNTPFAISNNSGNVRFYFQLDGGSADTFQLRGYNSSGTQILRVTSNTTALAVNNWYHIMLSVDLANSSNRHLYLNDVAVSSPNWSAYTNDNIALSEQDTFVGTYDNTQTGNVRTYMSNIYLDYTYRDLSVESNRRLFITSDDTPATGQASLNPILYLPFDSASLGSNSGTGGDLSTVGSPYYDEDFGPYIGTDGEGGLVWTKARTSTSAPGLYDTERGVSKEITSSATVAESSDNGVTAFNSDGYVIGNRHTTNRSGEDYVSWTFRKAPKFFDVVTYTGDGSASPRQIAHNLGSVPGFIIIKRTDSTSDWTVWHRSVTGNAFLQTTDTWQSGYSRITTPSSTTFTVGDSIMVNASGGTYVAYLFAHNDGDGEFGETGDQDIIKCGSFTTSAGSDYTPDTLASVNLGFEPQWILIKPANASGDWLLLDSMRGIVTPYANFSAGGNDNFLRANTSDVEVEYSFASVTSTGFNTYRLLGSTEYIYIAIRRGPMKTPESGTEVFAIDQTSHTTSRNVGFVPDTVFFTLTSNSTGWITSRLQGQKALRTTGTNIESNGPMNWDDPTNYWSQGLDSANLNYFWRRAPGFFDVVAYEGDGQAGRTVNHNLGVAPEMIWVKSRSNGLNWQVYHSGLDATAPEDYRLMLNTANARLAHNGNWNQTQPGSDVFTLGSQGDVNFNNYTYVAYLFATVPGVSKVGSYTGTGADLNVDCGFSAGARFVLVKRTDSTGDWYLWDSVRGIVSGNDPYILLNSNAAEVTNTDYVDPLASGFTITSSAPTALNASGGSYIFYAIA